MNALGKAQVGIGARRVRGGARNVPAQSIAGAWSSADTANDDSSVVVFLKNGTYFHVADARDADAPADVDGYERGTYTWNPATGAFTLTTLVNTDGEWGASEVSGLAGMSASLLGNGEAQTPERSGEAQRAEG